MNGYQDLRRYEEAVASGEFELVLIGCGTPRSESLTHALAATGGADVVWHVGGGTLRFLAGTDREAAAWLRRSGLQWLHRLVRNPRRMWKRYLLGNPRFVWRVFRSRRGRHRRVNRPDGQRRKSE